MDYMKRWCSKCVVADVETLDDLIQCLTEEVRYLKHLKADGVDACFCNIDDGLALFYTDDDVVAWKYYMDKIDDDESDDGQEFDDEDFDDTEFEDEAWEHSA